MVDFSAIASGFRQQRKDDRATRKDIADTFAQFRKDNPYATLDELTDRISSLTGGRNYLRAGLPEVSVLNQIADTNLQNKQNKEYMDNLNRRSETNELVDSYKTKAMEFLKSSIESSGTLLSPETINEQLQRLKNDFAKSNNINIGMDNDPFGLYASLDTIFTPENAQKFQLNFQNQAREQVLPMLKNAIQKDGVISKDEIANILRLTKIDKTTLVNEFIPAVEQEYQEEQGTKFLNMTSSMHAEIDNFLAGEEMDWRDGQSKNLEALTLSHMKDYLKNLGVPIPSEEMLKRVIKRRVNNIVTNWEDKKESFAIEGEEKLQGYQEKIAAKIEAQLNNPESNLYKAYEAGDTKEVDALIEQEIKTLTLNGRPLERYFGKENITNVLANIQSSVKATMDVTVKSIQENQRDELDEINENAIEASKKAVQKLIEDTNNSILMTFGKPDKPTPNSKLGNFGVTGNVPTAVLNLAKKYYLDQTSQDMIIQALKGYPDNGGTTSTEIYQYLESNLSGLLRPIDGVTSALAQTTTSRLGAFGDIKTFTAFLEKYNKDFEPILSQIQDNIINLDLSDPQGADKLNQYKLQIKSVLARAEQVMENARNTEDTWILNAQPDQWRKADAKKAFESIQETLNKLDAEASEKMDKLTPPTPGGTGTNDDEVTGIINSIGNNYASSSAKRDLENLFNQRAKTFFQRLQDEGLTSHKSVSKNIYSLGAGIGGANSKRATNIRSDINRQIMEEIDNYIDDMNNFRIIIQDTRLMEEFISDPKAFLNKNIGSIKDVLKTL